MEEIYEKKSFGKKDLIKLVVFVGILGIITALTLLNLFSDPAKLDSFFEELKTANIFWALVMFIAVPVIWLVTDSLVLWILTKRTYTVYKFRQALSAVGLYVIFSLLTPFQSGGQIFQIIYMRKQGVKYSTAVSSTVAAAVMFQLVTVPVSTALFAYTTLSGDMFGGLIIEGFSSNIIWWLTALALATNLILMVLPILISVSTRSLDFIARNAAKVTGLSFKKIDNADRDAKIFLGISALATAFMLFLLLFGTAVFGEGGLFPYAKLSIIGAVILTLIFTRYKFLELTDEKYKTKVISATESMHTYRDTFKATVFDKKILLPCLALMFIKEMNHSFSIVWAAKMIGQESFSYFDLMSLKNVLTLAQTTIPTPGGSGGAEFFYIAAANSIFNNENIANVVGLVTRFSTYWAILLWAVVFKLWWRPSRDGFGIDDRARINTSRKNFKPSKKQPLTETQVLKIKKDQ